MTIFVFQFSFAGLQCYQISTALKKIKLYLKWPLLLNMLLMSLWLHCNPAKNVGPARLYKRTSNLMCGVVKDSSDLKFWTENPQLETLVTKIL